jgi:N utilization substance protein A
MTITIDNYALRTMAFFKEKTNVSPLNCIVTKKSIIFLVDKGLVRKAIGRDALNVKYLRNQFKKDIKIFEKGESLDETIKNFIYPIKLNSSKIHRRVLAMLLANPNDRRKLLGNGQTTLKQLKEVINVYHQNIKDIKLL